MICKSVIYLMENNMKFWPYAVGGWFVLHGLNSVIRLNFQYEGTIMGVLALIAGVLVIIRA